MQGYWPIGQHACMRAYSEDLRTKIVEAVDRGMGKSEAARAFGVSLSSVKRYVEAVRQGRSLRPKNRPGMPPKIDERGRRLLQADVEARPAASLRQRRHFLERSTGLRVSESTVSRLLRRLGFSRKKEPWARASAMSG